MHDGPLQCGDCAEDNPSLRKQISSAFAHWQYTIAAVIQQAVNQNELPATNEPDSLAAFLLDSWEGALLRSQAEKNDAPLDTFLNYALNVLLTRTVKPRRKRRANH